MIVVNQHRLIRRVTICALLIVGIGSGGMTASLSAEPRSAKVAGEFYPDDRAELLDLTQYFLQQQPDRTVARKPRILIVPHAGYQYSGLVAAAGFNQLKKFSYDGVVVVGFTHRLQFPGASVDTRESYETPLGEIPVNLEAVAVLQTYPGISHLEEAHAGNEHSLEVELPFLQTVLTRFRIVPILMGSISVQEARQLADALMGLSRLGDYLFVFSTDLSHYHPHGEATSIDETTINSILSETPHAVARLFDRRQIEACGRGPILASLLLGDRLGYLKRELIYYANSGDTFGSPARVVGYAAITMTEPPAVSRGRLSKEAGNALVKASRRWLEYTVGARQAKPTLSLLRKEVPQLGLPELQRPAGIFVTLRKRGQLRGCIGQIESDQPLATSCTIVAVDAATHDPRFAPVTKDELGELQLEVSVLTPPTPIQRIADLVPGRDGVRLEFEGRRGVFLPQVWEETGWTRLEFLRELASQKAGLAADAWQHANLTVFQAQIFEESRPE